MPMSDDTRLELPTGSVDLRTGQVSTRDGVRRLSDRECAILSTLTRARGDSVSREELVRRVWHGGVAPGSRAVDLAIRRLRRKIELDPSEPAHLLTVYGVGYRLLLPRHRKRSSPRAAPRLIGRDADVQALKEALSHHRLVTLVGPGGVGKTTLARHVLATAKEVRTVEVDLGGARTGHELLHAVGNALAIPLRPTEPGHQLRFALASKGPLRLLLDNAEAVTAPLATAWNQWWGDLPGLRLVVTSRRPLSVPEERIISVPPLALEAALELFEQRARVVSGQAGSRAAVLELVKHLEGIPLAIELGAARTRTVRPEALVARRDQQLSWLRLPGKGGVAESVARSWALLEDADQAALRTLAGFQGAFSLHMAELALGPLALDRLELLVEHSLVQPVHAEHTSYRLLQTVRDFARGAALPPTLRAEADRAWAHAVLESADAPARRVKRSGLAEAYRHLLDLEPDLQRVLEAASDAGLRARAALILALTRDSACRPGDPLPQLPCEDELASCPAALREDVRHLRAELLGQAGRRDEARALLEEEEGMSEAVSLRRALARARLDVADGDTAERLLQRARALAAPPLLVEALDCRAKAASLEGEQTLARNLTSEQIAVAQVSGDRRAASRALAFQALELARAGDAQRALASLDQARAHQAFLHDPFGVLEIERHSSVLAFQLGDRQRAPAHVLAYRDLARRLGARAAEARAAMYQGVIEDDPAVAEMHHRESMFMAIEADVPEIEARATANLAVSVHLQRRFSEATEVYANALPRLRRARMRLHEARSAAWLAIARCQAGDRAGARRALDDAARLIASSEDPTAALVVGRVRAFLDDGTIPDEVEPVGDVQLTRRLLRLSLPESAVG